MEIVEYIYKGVVKPSSKKTTSADVNRVGHRRNMRGEAASSNTYYYIIGIPNNSSKNIRRSSKG